MRSRLVFIVTIAAAASAWAQGPSVTSSATFPWWNTPIVNTMNLSEAQMKQIHDVVAGHRERLRDIYGAVNKAEADLKAVFNQDPVDQRKGRQAVDALANARGDLTRELSMMSLELRTVLTAQQWEDLQNKQPGRGGRRRGNPAPTGSGPRTGATSPNSK